MGAAARRWSSPSAACRAPAARAPGPFALGSPERVRELLEQAGFAEVRVETLELHRRHASFEEFWETTLDLSRVFHDAVLARPQAEIEEIRAAVRARALRPSKPPTAASRYPPARSSRPPPRESDSLRGQ